MTRLAWIETEWRKDMREPLLSPSDRAHDWLRAARPEIERSWNRRFPAVRDDAAPSFGDISPRVFRTRPNLAWERDYKWNAHLRWEAQLGEEAFRGLLKAGGHSTIAARAVAIESRTNLLFSFEKMALRDAVKSPAGARAFAKGLYDLLHGDDSIAARFEAWCAVVAALPRRQTRVLTWPIATVFGFLAQPRLYFFLKPNVTRRAFDSYGLPFTYVSRPNATTYVELLALARFVKKDLVAMHPRDLIDIQSFLWVQGSDEYPD
jgi:hypothetical protein